MTNTNTTTLIFKEKHIICHQLFDNTKTKGIAQCSDKYPIKFNNFGNYTLFSTCYIYLLILP